MLQDGREQLDSRDCCSRCEAWSGTCWRELRCRCGDKIIDWLIFRHGRYTDAVQHNEKSVQPSAEFWTIFPFAALRTVGIHQLSLESMSRNTALSSSQSRSASAAALALVRHAAVGGIIAWLVVGLSVSCVALHSQLCVQLHVSLHPKNLQI